MKHIIQFILLLAILSRTTNANEDSSWLIRHEVTFGFPIRSDSYTDFNWYNGTVIDVKGNFCLISGAIMDWDIDDTTFFMNKIPVKLWINTNDIYSIDDM